MSLTYLIPPLVSILVGILISLITWGFIRNRNRKAHDGLMMAHDELLVGLLVVAVFVLGTSVALFLLSLV